MRRAGGATREREKIKRTWLWDRWRGLAQACAREDEFSPGESLARRQKYRINSAAAGRVTARVFERARQGATVSMSIQIFTEEQWGRLLRLLGETASLRSRIEIGIVPEGVGSAMESVGLSLIPRGPDGVSVRCSCGECAPDGWCRHVVTIAMALAANAEEDPLSAFELRGMAREDLLGRVGAIGMASGGARTGTTIHTPAVADLEVMRTSPLEEMVDRFWEAPVRAEVGDLSAHAPDTRQVLLRRLGSSPFTGAKFPLLGLLATCYDVLSERMSTEASIEGEGAEGEPER